MNAKPRRWLIAAGQFGLGLVLFGAVLWWLSPSAANLRLALHPQPVWIAVSVVGSAVAAIVTAARWKALAEAMGGPPLPYGLYFNVLCVTRVLAQFVPTVLADLLGRSAALRAGGSTQTVGRIATVVVVERSVDLAMPFLMLGWAIATKAAGTSAPATWGTWALVVLGFGVVATVALRPMASAVLRLYGWCRRILGRASTTVCVPHIPIPLAIRIVGLGLVRYVALAVQYWGFAAGAGVTLAWLVMMRAIPVSQLATLVAITPGGLGLQEGGWAGALAWQAVSVAEISVFLLAARAGMIVNFGLLALISLPWRKNRQVQAADAPTN